MVEFGGEEGPEGTWNLGGARTTGLVRGGGSGGAIAGVDGNAVAPSMITHSSSSSSIVIVDVIDALCNVFESV